MLIQLLVLFAALLILVVVHVMDDALRALGERLGNSTDGRAMRSSKRIAWIALALTLVLLVAPKDLFEPPPPQLATFDTQGHWSGADTTRIAFLDKDRRELVQYGRALIRNTAYYLGPNGTVTSQTNGMNCQNCHLDAGTKPWGNNYGAVWSTYPKVRARSGKQETVAKRVNDCFERSLNGTALDTNGREMKAILAYMEWLGTGIEQKAVPKGTGIVELAFMDRPADPVQGAAIYTAKCLSCHQTDGQGTMNTDSATYLYPPLWGEHSYNIGAGLYRLSRFAGYVKNNMPQGVTWETPQLSDAEAWDVAAYVNARQRPERDLSKDWPKIAGKPVDHPFGPYADGFSEEQHRFGPFGPIAEAKKASNKSLPAKP